MIDSQLRKYIQFIFNSMAKWLHKLNFTPNQITFAALLTGMFSALVLLPGWYSASLILLWLSGLFDVLDGSLARLSGKSSEGGAFLDLIFDRIVEALFVILFAVAIPELSLAVMVFLALVIFNFSTFLLATSIFENRGEKSMHYDSGLIERTETFIAFSIMLIFPSFSVYILWAFNFLILFTGIVRFTKIFKFINS